MDQEPDRGVGRKAKLGLELFAVYLLLYGGFAYLAAFRPESMGWKPFGGVDLAVWYGMALIVSPLLLAAIYLTPTADGNERGARHLSRGRRLLCS